ncbi:MAG: diapophytoene dehydrogenase [Bacteroidetes bacterium 4572_77]|nr:MAG: diapophytoene dehydrogenase [Bacteroidetes bacterium 4572_77]
MAQFEILMPKLGESIIEATITRWLKSVGDVIEEDDAIVEIATDKVDSEIPSPVDGKLIKLLYEEGDVIAVGEVIAIISLDGDEPEEEDLTDNKSDDIEKENIGAAINQINTQIESIKEESTIAENASFSSDRFYSPLVKSIAKTEGVSKEELENISGSGKDNRLTKADLLQYIEQRANKPLSSKKETKPSPTPPVTIKPATGDRIEEMDRMRKLIANHMVMSKQTSPHVTSFIEVDVTKIVNWRNKIKADFLKKEGEKITFTPIFMESVAKNLRNYPGINASVDGDHIIYKKNINIGMAAALPNGNLIVPVIKQADQKNLVGLTKTVNDLAQRSRANKLNPDDISGGTFTITNFGSFDSLTGTPIINQPQVAILGIGAIKKRAVVLETKEGDVIGIRSIMILSLAYDHRIVDGAMAGMFLRDLRNDMEAFNDQQ